MNKIMLTLFLLFGLTCHAEVGNSELQRVNDKATTLSQKVKVIYGQFAKLGIQILVIPTKPLCFLLIKCVT